MKALTPLDTPPDNPVPTGRWRAIPRLLGAAAIRLYQMTLSPLMPVTCRFIPSCSQYGLEAVRTYGLFTGARLTLVRIRRCIPTQPLGTPDPLPRHTNQTETDDPNPTTSP